MMYDVVCRCKLIRISAGLNHVKKFTGIIPRFFLLVIFQPRLYFSMFLCVDDKRRQNFRKLEISPVLIWGQILTLRCRVMFLCVLFKCFIHING